MNDAHIKHKELIVNYKGKPHHRIPKTLLDSQDCWENLEKIKQAHVVILDIYEIMEGTNDKTNLRLWDTCLNYLEEYLQSLWDFENNPNYIRFWDRPKCLCAKMDNDDSYPVGYYTMMGDCPLHGGFSEKDNLDRTD